MINKKKLNVRGWNIKTNQPNLPNFGNYRNVLAPWCGDKHYRPLSF